MRSAATLPRPCRDWRDGASEGGKVWSRRCRPARRRSGATVARRGRPADCPLSSEVGPRTCPARESGPCAGRRSRAGSAPPRRPPAASCGVQRVCAAWASPPASCCATIPRRPRRPPLTNSAPRRGLVSNRRRGGGGVQVIWFSTSIGEMLPIEEWRRRRLWNTPIHAQMARGRRDGWRRGGDR